MKKTLLFFAGSLFAFSLGAQEIAEPILVPDAFGLKLSRDGNVIIGQAQDGSALTFDYVKTNAQYYAQCYPGNGNCYSDNGILVGETMEYQALIMQDGKKTVPPSFGKYVLSSLQGITRDGRRACGYVESQELIAQTGLYYVPVYVDIDADGVVGEPVILPFPKEDFFEAPPQFCNATWISDDGKTILGQVADETGYYSYPIVYREGADGEWTYELPSESLFNPNKLPIPHYPGDFYDVYPDIVTPEYTNFMSEEMKQEFLDDLAAWEAEDGTEENNPWNYLFDIYMTPEEVEAYYECLNKWNEAGEEYNKLYDEWREGTDKIVAESVFFAFNGSAMNPQGTSFCAASVSYGAIVPGTDLPEEYYGTYLFDITNGTFTSITSPYNNLIPHQMLYDGTVYASSPMSNIASGNVMPCQSFVMLPESKTFIPAMEWVKSLNAPYGNWMEEALTNEVLVGYNEVGMPVYQELLVSGYMCSTDDYSVIAGGVEGHTFQYDYDFFTYIMANVTAGVGKVSSADAGIYRVYNLNGINVLTTKEASEINDLTPGLYIVNGKKVIVK